jgi:hypothetical protein
MLNLFRAKFTILDSRRLSSKEQKKKEREFADLHKSCTCGGTEKDPEGRACPEDIEDQRETMSNLRISLLQLLSKERGPKSQDYSELKLQVYRRVCRPKYNNSRLRTRSDGPGTPVGSERSVCHLRLRPFPSENFFNRFYFHLVCDWAQMVWNLFVNGSNGCKELTTYHSFGGRFQPQSLLRKLGKYW